MPIAGYRVDLLVRGRVVVEFEGTHHDSADVQSVDRARFNALAAVPGLPALRYGSRDLARLGAVVAEVRAAVGRQAP